jgi:hypothetical protein
MVSAPPIYDALSRTWLVKGGYPYTVPSVSLAYAGQAIPFSLLFLALVHKYIHPDICLHPRHC